LQTQPLPLKKILIQNKIKKLKDHLPDAIRNSPSGVTLILLVAVGNVKS
jgi:hypothetical protein